MGETVEDSGSGRGRGRRRPACGRPLLALAFDGSGVQARSSRKKTPSSGRLRQQHRRRGLRRYPQAGSGRGPWTVAIPQHALRPQGRRNHAADGPRARRQVTPEVAQEICLRTGSKALLAGSISRLGTNTWSASKRWVVTPATLWPRSKTKPPVKRSVLKALSGATSSLRAKLGESLASVQKFDVPIEATTSSLEALKAFSMGVTSAEGTSRGHSFLQAGH